MGYNIITDPSNTPVKDSINDWVDNYKESLIEHHHDHSMLSLLTPDDSLIVVGPPRLSMGSDDYYVVGLINGFQFSETAQVQPFKSVGSRRHIFSKTNSPVQGSIQRMMVLGANLARALYAVTDAPDNILDHDNNELGSNDSNTEDSMWYSNLEEDLYRIPFGLGIIYGAPATRAGGDDRQAGAEFIEMCVLQNRQVSMQSGQTMIMENVTFMADRVIPWPSYSSDENFDSESWTNKVENHLT